jgi:hypothetical protein
MDDEKRYLFRDLVLFNYLTDLAKDLSLFTSTDAVVKRMGLWQDHAEAYGRLKGGRVDGIDFLAYHLDVLDRKFGFVLSFYGLLGVALGLKLNEGPNGWSPTLVLLAGIWAVGLIICLKGLARVRWGRGLSSLRDQTEDVRNHCTTLAESVVNRTAWLRLSNLLITIIITVLSLHLGAPEWLVLFLSGVPVFVVGWSLAGDDERPALADKGVWTLFGWWWGTLLAAWLGSLMWLLFPPLAATGMDLVWPAGWGPILMWTTITIAASILVNLLLARQFNLGRKGMLVAAATLSFAVGWGVCSLAPEITTAPTIARGGVALPGFLGDVGTAIHGVDFIRSVGAAMALLGFLGAWLHFYRTPTPAQEATKTDPGAEQELALELFRRLPNSVREAMQETLGSETSPGRLELIRDLDRILNAHTIRQCVKKIEEKLAEREHTLADDLREIRTHINQLGTDLDRAISNGGR